MADANETYYYHFDGLGSVVALSDVNNVLLERYAYDVFGRPTIRDANGAEISETAVGNPYLFTARRYDAETALYYYRARYYDYYAGRFLQPDPLGYVDGLNMYAYVGNNPVGGVDPLGLCKEEPGGILSSIGQALRATPDGLRSTVEILAMAPSYYENFRGVDYGSGEAVGLAAIMTLGNAIGFGPFLEGIVGVDALEQRELFGIERFLRTAGGAAQTVATITVLHHSVKLFRAPSATAHGAARMQDPTRLSAAEIVETRAAPTRIMTQADGATVYIKEVAPGKFNVVVDGRGGHVTNFRHLNQKNLDRLARNYGHH